MYSRLDEMDFIICVRELYRKNIIGWYRMKSREYEEVIRVLSNMIGEGVHIVDSKGKTIVYNSVMERLERTDGKNVIGIEFDKAFEHIPSEESTIKKALLERKSTILSKQIYKIRNGQEIHTINSTVPVIYKGRVVAAIETSSAMRNVQDNDEVEDRDKKIYRFKNIVAKNKQMKECVAMAQEAAKSDVSVILRGDVGTGKELLAKTIHFDGNKKEGIFLSQSCGGIQEERLDEILFGVYSHSNLGYENTMGLLEAANGGSLFLDELETIPYQIQEKLLRALQEGYIRRIGSKEIIPINVRIIVAIESDPLELIEKGLLKKELFFRLSGISIDLPPLSQRKEDIEKLFFVLLEKECKKKNRQVPVVEKDGIEKLKNHNYLGNIRELENIMISTLAGLGKKMKISANDIVFRGYDKKTYSSVVGYYSGKESLDSFIANMEKKIIWEAMERNRGNISLTARELGMKRQTLQHKLKKYGNRI